MQQDVFFANNHIISTNPDCAKIASIIAINAHQAMIAKHVNICSTMTLLKTNVFRVLKVVLHVKTRSSV